MKTITACITFVLFLSAPAYSIDKLVGIWGIPNSENLEALTSAGVDTIIFSSPKTQISKIIDLPLKKIGSLGISPNYLEKVHYDNSTIEKTIDDRFLLFDVILDIYGYSLLGDAIPGIQEFLWYAMESRGLDVEKRPYPFVVLMALQNQYVKMAPTSVDIFAPKSHIISYYYPLMRRDNPLDKQLQAQLEVNNKIHSQYESGAYASIQTHSQRWYLEAGKLAGWLTGCPNLYPDGQVVLMLFYYALASGADGYFFYDGTSNFMGTETGQERAQAIAQGLLETKQLRAKIGMEVKMAELIQIKKGKIFGSILKGTGYDLIFLFNSDKSTAYTHPSTEVIAKNLGQLIDAKFRGYHKVYKWTPFELFPLSKHLPVSISQEKPTILLGTKDQYIDLHSFLMGDEDIVSYRDALMKRAALLRGNMQKYLSATLDNPPHYTDYAKSDCNNYLSYISALDELKRNEWLAHGLPVNGDRLKDAEWKGKLTEDMIQGQVLNFYFR
jgi:hypothetical protein